MKNLIILSLLFSSCAYSMGGKKPSEFPIRNPMNSIWQLCKSDITKACKPVCNEWKVGGKECKKIVVERQDIQTMLKGNYYLIHKSKLMELLTN
jgi:hypothetical protein